LFSSYSVTGDCRLSHNNHRHFITFFNAGHVTEGQESPPTVGVTCIAPLADWVRLTMPSQEKEAGMMEGLTIITRLIPVWRRSIPKDRP
jgi:hypothetical protein